MGSLASLLLLLTFPEIGRAETFIWFQPWTNAAKLVEVLRTIPQGKALVDNALKKDERLLDHIQAGKASYTESLPGAAGKTRQRILIRRGLKLSDAVCDLAHELFHLTYREPFDPYEMRFSKSIYVREGIENAGGELRAFRTECLVAWQLEAAQPAFPKHTVCQKFRKTGTDEFDFEAARIAFFAIGKWHPKFDSVLKDKIPELNAGEPVFNSGVVAKPYPVSLAEEFGHIIDAACERNRASYKSLALKAKSMRGPTPPSLLDEKKKLEDFHERHCRAPVRAPEKTK